MLNYELDINELKEQFFSHRQYISNVPTHPSFKNFGAKYGIGKFSACKGLQTIISQNIHTTYNNNIMQLIELFKTKTTATKSYKLRNYDYDYNFMSNFSDCYIANLNQRNPEFKKLNDDEEIFIKDFLKLKYYKIYNTDTNNNFNHKAVMSLRFKKFKEKIEEFLNFEKHSFTGLVENYITTHHIKLARLRDYNKARLLFNEKEIYYSMLFFISNLIGRELDIPIKSSAILIEIHKTDFTSDLKDFVKASAKYFAKSFMLYDKLQQKNLEIFKNRNPETSISLGKRFEARFMEVNNTSTAPVGQNLTVVQPTVIKSNVQNQDTDQKLFDPTKIYTQDEFKAFQANANFKADKAKILETVGDLNLYFVKIYHNQDLLYQKPLTDFLKTFDAFTETDTVKLEEFCVPVQISKLKIYSIGLLALVIAETVVIMILLKRNK